MRFDIITIFPRIFDSYFNQSIIKRAQAKKLVDIHIHDLRKFTRDRHKKVDDRPYGGGPGMVLQIEPLARAIDSILKDKSKKTPHQNKFDTGQVKDNPKIILFTAGGKQFASKMAREWVKKYDRIIMIAGHYEGIDARVINVIRNWKLEIVELSVGPYVLTGGEIPAMIVVDAVSRHIKGVLGKHESLEEKRHGIGVPTYTRPEEFRWRGKIYHVPKVLLTGNHKKIEEWRKRNK